MFSLFMASFFLNIISAYYFALTLNPETPGLEAFFTVTCMIFAIVGTVIYVVLTVAKIINELEKGE